MNDHVYSRDSDLILELSTPQNLSSLTHESQIHEKSRKHEHEEKDNEATNRGKDSYTIDDKSLSEESIFVSSPASTVFKDDVESIYWTHANQHQRRPAVAMPSEISEAASYAADPKKSWRAPIVMVSSLLLGLFLALAHHSLNVMLDGKLVSTGAMSQQWTSRYTTTIAFLVKTLFIICVGIVYVQCFWLKMSTYRREIRINDLDVISNGLTDFFLLISSMVWLKNPLLLFVVMISWTIPFAAIVTPATLVVNSKPCTRTINQTIPKLSFDWDVYTLINDPINGIGDIASQLLSKTAFATAAMSQTLPAKPDHANQSYTTTFFGPALRCRDADLAMRNAASSIAFWQTAWYFSWAGSEVPWIAVNNELSWKTDFPWSSVGWNDVLLISNDTHLNNYLLSTGQLPFDDADGDSLWIASGLGNSSSTSNYTIPTNVTECRLWNASYSVRFDYENWAQTTTVEQLTYENPAGLTAAVMNSGYQATRNTTYSYIAILSSIGSLLVGKNPNPPPSHYALTKIDFTDSEATARGVEELFQNITLSLFSDPTFLSNETDIVPIRVTNWPLVYVYERQNLLLAYGLAFLFSLLCCILGLHAFYVSQNSYQNNFSSYMRAAANSNIDFRLFVALGDTGADPLPEDIARRTITLRSMETR